MDKIREREKDKKPKKIVFKKNMYLPFLLKKKKKNLHTNEITMEKIRLLQIIIKYKKMKIHEYVVFILKEDFPYGKHDSKISKRLDICLI